MKYFRPSDLAEPTYTPRERDRRDKWLARQLAKGRTGITIHDAPPPSHRKGVNDDWVDRCGDCNAREIHWDIGVFTDENGRRYLKRFCRICLWRANRLCRECRSRIPFDAPQFQRYCDQACQKRRENRRARERMQKARAS